MPVDLFSNVFKKVGTAINQAITPDILKDRRHASKLFVDDQYKLVPKNGFLYHVFFDINQLAASADPGNPNRDRELGMLVKSVGLPKYSVDLKKLNAYNRPNYVQTKLTYDSLTITFHDDSADVVRNFWFDYVNYYYRDTDYSPELYKSPHKYSPTRMSDQWGYTTRFGTDVPYLNGISIYSLSRKRFSEYRLINPIIRSFRHGEHTSSGTTDLLQHEMTIDFETVLYFNGTTSPQTVNGFADLHYDKTPSPLTPAGGGTKSITGVGGLFETGSEAINDLAEGNYAAAIFKGAKAIKTGSEMNLKKAAVSEIIEIGKGVIRGNNPENRIFVPNLPSIAGDLSTIGSKISSSGIGTGISGPGTWLGGAAGLSFLQKGKATKTPNEPTDAASFRSGAAPATPRNALPLDKGPLDFASQPASLRTANTVTGRDPKPISQTTINARGEKFELNYKLNSETQELNSLKVSLQKIKEQKSRNNDINNAYNNKLENLLEQGFDQSSILVQDISNQISQLAETQAGLEIEIDEYTNKITNVETSIEYTKLRLQGLK